MRVAPERPDEEKEAAHPRSVLGAQRLRAARPSPILRDDPRLALLLRALGHEGRIVKALPFTPWVGSSIADPSTIFVAWGRSALGANPSLRRGRNPDVCSTGE